MVTIMLDKSENTLGFGGNMADTYVEMMLENENACQRYHKQAKAAREDNGGKHCKEELEFLRQEETVRHKMAANCSGEESVFYEKLAGQVADQIREAVEEVGEPDKKADNRSSLKEEIPRHINFSGENNSENKNKWHKDKPHHSLSDISGMVGVKEKLKQCLADNEWDELKEYLEMAKLHAFFFYGIPGCGKSFIVQALAHELMEQDYTYLFVEASDILSRFVGGAEKNIGRVFDEAMKCAPCILFLDEIDGVCRKRAKDGRADHTASLTTAFLTGYNRISSSDQEIILIAATNFPDEVDNAFLDRVEMIHVPLPDMEAREGYFRNRLKGSLMLAEDITFREMAEQTEGMSFRDTGHIVKNIMSKIIEINKSSSDERIIEDMKSGTIRLTKKLFDEELSTYVETPKKEDIARIEAWEKGIQDHRESL